MSCPGQSLEWDEGVRTFSEEILEVLRLFTLLRESKELGFTSLPRSHVSVWGGQLVFHGHLVTFQTVFSASV